MPFYKKPVYKVFRHANGPNLTVFIRARSVCYGHWTGSIFSQIQRKQTSIRDLYLPAWVFAIPTSVDIGANTCISDYLNLEEVHLMLLKSPDNFPRAPGIYQ